MLDNDLRELFDKWAQPMRTAVPPSLSVIRRRQRRRTARIAVTAMISVAAVAVVASVVGTSLATGRGTAHSPAAGAAPLTAPYYVTVSQSGSSAAVWDAATGRQLGSVQAPAESSATGHRYPTVFTNVAAGSDRSFVLGATVSNNTTVDMPAGLFELELAANGSPGPLRPLRLALRQGRLGHWIVAISSIALTADASELAIATNSSADNAEISGPSRIEVVSLATGFTRKWTATAWAAKDISSLSWAGDSTLAYTCEGPAVCMLSTSGQGHSLNASRPLIPASASYDGLSTPDWPVITPDGSDIYVAMGKGGFIGLVEFSARTGLPLRVVIQPQPNDGAYCGTLWSDPSGQHLTAACTWGSHTGTISDGVFTPGRNLPPATPGGLMNGAGTSLIAW